MEESQAVQHSKNKDNLSDKPRVKLDFLNAYGSMFASNTHDISNSIHFLDDQDTPILAYPVGRHIGVRNIQNNEMKFIRQSETIKEVTAMAMSPNKKFLAVCEKHKNDFSAYITFYDMKNPLFTNVKSHINVCDSTPTNQKQIISISFSNDSKYIACLLDTPDCKAIAWDWYNKNTIIGQYDFGQLQVTKITFNPKDNHQVCTSGHNHFKLWRVQENTFKSMQPFAKVNQNHVFQDHAWLDEDRLISCTSEGEIYVLENFEMKQLIDNAFRSDELYNISCILPYSKGFFVASDNGDVALWVKSEENQKSNGKDYYDFIRRWPCEGLKGIKITSMAVSPSEEHLALACKNNNIGIVNVKSIGLNEDTTKSVKFEKVCGGFHSGAITSMDIATQRPILATASKDDATIRLWNYYTNTCELAREYYVLEDVAIREAAKPLLAIAMHPSGYYMAASFIDKIRIFHILHDELKHFRTIEVKNCYHMKFSNGGQWFACADQKQLKVFDSYTLKRLCFQKIPQTNITDLKFSPRDDYLALVTQEGHIYRYFTNKTLDRQSEGCVDRNNDYRSCTFLTSEHDDLQLVVVGGDGQHSQIKIVDKKYEAAETFYGNELKMTQCAHVKTRNQIENIITGTEKGNIKIYNYPLKSTPFDEFNAHYGEISRIIISPDSRYVFTSGADGTVFVFSVTEYQDEKTLIKGAGEEESKGIGSDEVRHMIVDEELANIVLVKKEEMDEWRKRQEQYKIEMEETNNKVEFKIQEMKVSYSRQMEDLETQKQKEIKSLDKRYEDLKAQKSAQEHENSQAMKKMELNHLQCVEELQNLYERKLYIENSNYLKLEQEKIEMKNLYEDRIKQLQKQNEQAIERLLKEFTGNLGKVQEEYEDSKKTADGLKMMYEEKLTQQEDEHEAEINDLKSKHQNKIDKLQQTIGALKGDLETKKRALKRVEDEKDNEEKRRLKAQNKKNHYKKVYEERCKQITLLEKEKLDLQAKLKTRETDLYRYKFKIKDLQKSKHVLTHRTTEMRASLEPKEHQIESLKEQLLNLEKVFEKQTNTMNKLEEELQKRASKINQINQELNQQINLKKEKEKIIFEFINDVHKAVQMKNEKDYVKGLMELNQKYVMPRSQELLDMKKKDPDTIEELDRHLRYMERSIATLKVNTIKNETRTKNDIKKRTKENTHLIHELNELRMENKLLKVEIKKISNHYEKIKMELKKEKAGGDYGPTGAAPSDQKFAQSMTAKGKGDDESIPNMLHRPRSAVRQAGGNTGSKSGKVFKGTPFDHRKGNLEDKARIAELTAQLEDNNQQILFQKIEIRTLKEQLIKILEERNQLIGGEPGPSQPYTPSRTGEDVYGGRDSATGGGTRPGTQGKSGGMGGGSESGFLPKVDSRANL